MNGNAFHPVAAQSSHPRPDVLLRTRRSVMEAAHEMRAQRTRQRRQVGIALLVLTGLVVLVTPAIWTGVSDLTAGEHFFDMPFMVEVLSLAMLSAVFAVCLLSWKRGSPSARDDRG
jgi:hypothetical protein